MIAEMNVRCQYHLAIWLSPEQWSQKGEAMRILQRITVAALIAAGSAVAAASVFSQHYPVRPVRYICPFPPSDGVDFITRIIAAVLGET
jgi:hypothetical protein